MEIKCLGGVKEIGGNKILVEHKGTRVFLDFGMSFNQHYKYFSEYLNPRMEYFFPMHMQTMHNTFIF